MIHWPLLSWLQPAWKDLFFQIHLVFLISIWLSVSENASLKVIWNLSWWLLEKILTWQKKKQDCLKMKMCEGVHLRRVKVKSFVRKWQMRETPFLLICHLSMRCVSWWSPHLRLWTHVYVTLIVAAVRTYVFHLLGTHVTILCN